MEASSNFFYYGGRIGEDDYQGHPSKGLNSKTAKSFGFLEMAL